MTHPIESLDAIRLTVCEVDKAHLPVWLSNFPDSRGDNTIGVVTWLRPEIVSQIGLPKESICGFLTDPSEIVSPKHFVEYSDFVDAILRICRNLVDPQLVDFASRIHEGKVALIDQRSPDVDAEIPTEDIIGTYRIKNGSVSEFSPNSNFRLVTSKGCFQLTPWLRSCLLSLVRSTTG